jgi:hypothetical protein
MSKPYSRPAPTVTMAAPADPERAPVVAPPLPAGLQSSLTPAQAAEALGDDFLRALDAGEEIITEDEPAPMPLVRRTPRDPVATAVDDYPARLVSVLVDTLETAMPNAKFVHTDARTGTLATPDQGEIRGQRSDPLVRYLTGRCRLTKTAEGAFMGYLPLGAARDVREHYVPGTSARAVFRAMVKLVHGE